MYSFLAINNRKSEIISKFLSLFWCYKSVSTIQCFCPTVNRFNGGGGIRNFHYPKYPPRIFIFFLNLPLPIVICTWFQYVDQKNTYIRCENSRCPNSLACSIANIYLAKSMVSYTSLLRKILQLSCKILQDKLWPSTRVSSGKGCFDKLTVLRSQN